MVDTLTPSTFDVTQFRDYFPALHNGQIYLDSAATALKPQPMIAAINQYYSNTTATVNRSLHQTAQALTQQVEHARQKVADLIHAASAQQIIWTRGTTEALNLVAYSYALSQLQTGDEIIVSELEHHSNLIPWLIIAEKTGAKVVKWPSTTQGALQLDDLQARLNSRTKIVAVTQMSNLSGFVVDLAAVSALVHQTQAILVVDGAQGIVHQPIDVQALDIDFYAFSAHKYYGPTGLGILYAKAERLAEMQAWHGGGKMLVATTFADFVAQPAPAKFEAGTPHIAGQLGLAATLDWAANINWTAAEKHTRQVADYLREQLQALPLSTIYSVPHSPIIAFNFANIHHSDIGILLAEHNIALRTGQMCAQPLVQRFGCHGLIRASIAAYNNEAEIDQLLLALHETLAMLS